MNTLNKTGPKTEPCGTPFVRSSHSLVELPTRTRWFLPERYDRWVHMIFHKLRRLLVWPRGAGGAGSRTLYLGPWGQLQHAYVSPAPPYNHQWVSTAHLDNYTRVCRRLFSGQVSPAESGSSDGEWFFREPSTFMVGCSRVCSFSCWGYRLFCTTAQPLPV